MYHHIQLKFCLFKTRKIDTRKKNMFMQQFPERNSTDSKGNQWREKSE